MSILLFIDKLKDGGLVSVFRQKTLAPYEGRTTILVSPEQCEEKLKHVHVNSDLEEK